MLSSLLSNIILSYLILSTSKTTTFLGHHHKGGSIFAFAAPHLDPQDQQQANPTQATTSTTTTTTTTRPSIFIQSNDQVSYLSELQLEPSNMQEIVVASPEAPNQSNQPNQPNEDPSRSPRSERQPILDMFTRFFLKARSHDDQDQKDLVRDGVIMRLRELGFDSSFVQKSRFEFRRKPAVSYNMVSILPGRHRHTEREQIVLVGAHWDSATKAPGVDDNGSGSACLLEIARLISINKCSFNHTIMLVWFDYEEQGKYGSEFFVNDYLFPLELEKYKSKFIGAYILDMILVRDKENNTQTLPISLKTKLTDFFEELESEKNRGDFLATWARKTWDEPLENAFRYAWQDLGFEARTFKAMRPELPQSSLPNSEERFYWKDFFRSDHASFWFPPIISTAVRRAPNRNTTARHPSLNAILLTDLGPWRRSYTKCYHSACDDEHFLTDNNLAFMQQVVDTLVLTLMRVGQGQCQALNAALVEVTTTEPTTITTLTNSTNVDTSLAPPPPALPQDNSTSIAVTTTTTSTTTMTPLDPIKGATSSSGGSNIENNSAK